jgi:flagellar assembly factor FliW
MFQEFRGPGRVSFLRVNPFILPNLYVVAISHNLKTTLLENPACLEYAMP